MTAHTRTTTWSPPLGPGEAAALDGLEFLRGLVEGRFPRAPFAATLGFDLVDVDEGYAVFEVETGEHLLNPLGIVHGGVALTLVDSAAGCAAQTTLTAGVGYTTLETKANFVRAIAADTGLLRCEGRLVHAGRTTIVAEGRVTSVADGALRAFGTSTLLVLRP